MSFKNLHFIPVMLLFYLIIPSWVVQFVMVFLMIVLLLSILDFFEEAVFSDHRMDKRKIKIFIVQVQRIIGM